MNNQYKFYSSTTQEYGTIGWMVRIHFPFNISAVLWKEEKDWQDLWLTSEMDFLKYKYFILYYPLGSLM